MLYLSFLKLTTVSNEWLFGQQRLTRGIGDSKVVLYHLRIANYSFGFVCNDLLLIL